MPNPITHITRSEFVELLRNVETPSFIAMVSKTPVDMAKYDAYWIEIDGKRKKNPNAVPNPFFDLGIENLSRKYKILTGFDYAKSVNARLEREGKDADFVAKETWHLPISKALVTDRKTESKFYLRYQYMPDSTLETEYTYNGDPIGKELFKQYMADKSNSYANQGLDNTLNFQVCNVDNLLEVSMNGTRYVLQ
jgi:hypothetical protein